ncbi:MAG: alpha/beta hydrolase [Pseudomonadota bacterium]
MIGLKKLNIHSDKLFSRELVPENPLAYLFIIHGYAEHSGRYIELMKAMHEKQIACFVSDQLGHGQSSGKKGFIESFDDYADTFFEYFKKKIKEY